MAGGDQVFGNHLAEEDLKPVFDAAQRLGLNFWDTAAVYGEGSSERILGNFIKDVPRDQLIISTKFPPQIASDSSDAMQEMLNGSLKRLHTDYIDLYWSHNPADVEKWTPQLIPLASSGQIRSSVYGGHVSPDLGVVEATIALCRIFDFPTDKIVWDVSHQVDVWKMLTGRMEAFIKPEPYSVIGEYTLPNEAPEYDLFYAGHTSPSVSLSLGLARARNLRGEKFNVMAFIGDGSLSGGEAFEGLNEAAVLRNNFIVIVNDNQMSIPHDHGGLYRNLRDLRESNGTCPDNYFRALGYDYHYVAEGNDIAQLTDAFSKVKDCTWPTVVHINTQKGEGYVPAEANREEFHCHSRAGRGFALRKHRLLWPGLPDHDHGIRRQRRLYPPEFIYGRLQEN